MLEKLPDTLGHVLRGQRAGLEKIAFHLIDLRQGMGAIDVKSLAFVDHAPLPPPYTADGEGLSPPLQWTGVPAGAGSVVLMVEDADSPTPQPLVHAIVVDMPVEEGAVAQGALKGPGHDGVGLTQGRNSFLQARWLPPDPPPGHGVHRYAFQVFALDTAAPAWSDTPGRDEVLTVLRDHAVASGCLIGTYERPDGSIKSGAESPVALTATPAA